MAWHSTLTTLRNRLAALFPNQTDARLIVEEAGMDTAHIPFDAKAINNWHGILGQAELRGKIEDVVVAALSNYPGDQPLIDAFTAYMNANNLPVDLPLELLEPPPSPPPGTAKKSAPGTGQGGHTTVYNVNTGGGTFVGGNVQSGGDFVGHDKTSGSATPSQPSPSPSSPSLSDNERSGLQALLAQHEKNLLRLQQQKATYGAGEEPLRILNQIDHEEEEIAKLNGQLGVA